MIRTTDALMMAYTKLKTRKVRTAFTVAIAGIMFGLAMTLVLLTDGVFLSLDRMTAKSMTGRFVVGGQQTLDNGINDVPRDPRLINEALRQHKDLVARKKAEAKRLGIEYDAAQDPAPVETYNGQQMLSYSSPIAQKIMDEAAREKNPERNLTDFKRFADAYHPTAYYTVTSLQPKNGQVVEMKKGVEEFTTSPDEKSGAGGYMSGQADLQQATLVPQRLLTNYLLADAKWQPESGHVPVVISQKRAVELTGYKPLTSDAPAADRLAYINELRKRANGAVFSACYRNSVSSQRIVEAVETAKATAAHKNDNTYQKPAVVYGTPDPGSCDVAPVLSDTRSVSEKQYASKQKQFDQTFGVVVDPVQQKITYEVVGIAPNGWADMDQGFSMGVKDIVSSMLMSQTFRFAIPTEMYERLPNKAQYQEALSAATNNGNLSMMGVGQYFAEFDNASAARDFAKNETCQYGMSPTCTPTTKYFMLAPFGSNSIGLDEVKRGVMVGLLWFVGAITIIAAIIAGLTIGRTIADGRRETAVFRAIGFRRIDINQIYITYTLWLCLRIAVFAFLIGFVLTALTNHFLWLDTTVQSQLALGVTDSSTHFTYIGFTPKILIIVAAILVAGLVGMLTPLIRNMRRNPIHDMRDE